MKITLVNPAPKIWIKSKTLPLGLAYVAAVLERDGHQVHVVDLNVEPGAIIPDAELVGVTATTPLVYQAWRIAEAAKRKGSLTVLGGPHPTCLPSESLEQSGVDFVVRGEGELTIVELCQALATGGGVANIAGLSHKRGAEIVHNPDRPFISDLDDLPFPAFHLFPALDKYTNAQPLISTRSPTANVLTSRGCPFNCSFCYKGTFGRVWRYRSAAHVLDEWRLRLEESRPQEISIQDDSFNIDIPRSIELCERIVAEGLVIPWSTPNGIRADRVSEGLLRKMKAAGCYRVAYGVENGSDEMLRRMGKNITLSQITEAFRVSKKVGLETMAFFILGNPDEDRDTMQRTIDFACRLDPDFAQFTIATPYPGTALYDLVKKEGTLLVDKWDDYTTYSGRAFFRYGEITEQLMQEMMSRAYRRFYLRPGYIFKTACRPQAWRNLPNVISGGLHLVFGK